MIIGICGLDSLAGSLETFKPDAVVAVCSPRYQYVPPFTGPMLGLICHDIEGDQRGCIAPALRHGLALQDFLAEHKPKRLLVQCRAGLSRSPAFALHAAMTIDGCAGPAEQVARLAAVAPALIPNRLILRVADYCLGLEPHTGLYAARDRAWASGPRTAYGALGEAQGLAWWATLRRDRVEAG